MAYDFNGTNQYLRTSSSPVSAMPLTISCWFNGDAGGTLFPLVVISNSSDNSRVNIVRSGGDIVAAAVDSSNTSALASSGGYSSGSWTHICGVHSSTTLRTLFVNGSLQSTGSTALGSFGSFNQISIGSNHLASAFTDGRIAEVGIWSVALTAAEIASLADGFTCDKVRPQSLVFYAPLVRSLQDVRGGLTITNNNTATVANHPRVYA